MSVDCEIRLEYEDEARARVVLKSIEQDNTPFARAVQEGSEVLIKASARNIPSIIHTLEDLLVCVKVAEEMLSETFSKKAH